MAEARSIRWPGGEHDFLLTIGDLRALQDHCDAGPAAILRRLAANDWRVDDVLETLRLGLRGGGMGKEEARQLVERTVEDCGLLRLAVVAQLVLSIALVGVEDDPVGEPAGGMMAPKSPSAEDGASAGSTAAEPLPDSPPVTSTP